MFTLHPDTPPDKQQDTQPPAKEHSIETAGNTAYNNGTDAEEPEKTAKEFHTTARQQPALFSMKKAIKKDKAKATIQD